jgi:hypothetical protein
MPSSPMGFLSMLFALSIVAVVFAALVKYARK